MTSRAVTLVELVIAVVILGILAAIAIPQLTAAAAHSPEEQLRSDLVRLRTAIELYYQDHGAYPGQRPAGAPAADAGTAAAMIRQLTQYTDADGRASPTSGDVFRFGPYLRDEVPRCPVLLPSRGAGFHLIAGAELPGYRDVAQNAGWVYNYETGYIAANSPELDTCGVRYDTY